MKKPILLIVLSSLIFLSCKNEEGSSNNKNPKVSQPETQGKSAYAEEIETRDYKILYYEKTAPNVNVPKIYDSLTGTTQSFSSVRNQLVTSKGVHFDGDIFVKNGYGITRFNSANSISANLNLNPPDFYTRGLYEMGGSLYSIARSVKLEAKLIKWNTNLNVIDTVIDFPKTSNGELHVCTIGNISYITNGEFYSFNHSTQALTQLSSNSVGYNRYNKMLCVVDKVILSNHYRPTYYNVHGYNGQLEVYDVNTNTISIEFNEAPGGAIENIQRMNEKIFFTYRYNGHYKLNVYDLVTKTRIDLSVGQFDQFLIHSLSMNGTLAVYSLANDLQETIYMYYNIVTGLTGNLSTLGVSPTPNTYMYDIFNGDGVSWFVTQRQDVYQRPDLVQIDGAIPTILNPSNFPQDSDGNYLEVKFIGVGYDDLILTYQGLIYSVDKNGIFTELATTNDSPAYSELFYY